MEFFGLLIKKKTFTYLAGHDHNVILGDVKPRWSKTVSIQSSADVSPIGKRNQSRAIPGFHCTGCPMVVVTLLFRHCGVVLPCFRYHRHHSLKHHLALNSIFLVFRILLAIFFGRHEPEIPAHNPPIHCRIDWVQQPDTIASAYRRKSDFSSLLLGPSCNSRFLAGCWFLRCGLSF